MDYLEVIKMALEEIKIILRNHREKKNLAFNAIEKIQAAANATQNYYSQNPIEIPNLELSNLWLDAASAVRKLDENLYNMLLYKSEYWANPEAWLSLNRNPSSINLNEIVIKSRELIKKR